MARVSSTKNRTSPSRSTISSANKWHLKTDDVQKSKDKTFIKLYPTNWTDNRKNVIGHFETYLMVLKNLACTTHFLCK